MPRRIMFQLLQTVTEERLEKPEGSSPNPADLQVFES